MTAKTLKQILKEKGYLTGQVNLTQMFTEVNSEWLTQKRQELEKRTHGNYYAVNGVTQFTGIEELLGELK